MSFEQLQVLINILLSLALLLMSLAVIAYNRRVTSLAKIVAEQAQAIEVLTEVVLYDEGDTLS